MQAVKANFQSPKVKIGAALAALFLVIVAVSVWRVKKARAHAPARAAKNQAPEPSAGQRVNLGMAALEARNLDEAITQFSGAIKKDPATAPFYVDRALAYDLKREYDKAIADCAEAIKLDAKNGEAFYVRGLCYTAKKEYAKALSDFDSAMNLDWKNVECYLRRGDVYVQKKDFDKAFTDYDDAAKLDPQRAEAYAGRGLVYEKKKDYEKAIADYAQALRLDPQEPQYYQSLAWIYATCPKPALRNGQQAFDYALYACKLTNWKEPQYFDTLGAACAELGLFADAIKWAKRAMDSPQFATSTESVKPLRSRLKGYEAGKPYREP